MEKTLQEYYKEYCEHHDVITQEYLNERAKTKDEPFIYDNGNEMHESTFWCGYFECLYGANIECVEDDDMSFIL